MNNARAKPAKLLFFIVKICKFVTFLSLSSLRLLKLPNESQVPVAFLREFSLASKPEETSYANQFVKSTIE